jgi:hypothetical protein
MRNRVITLVGVGIFSVGISCGESRAVARCAGEIAAMHGVWVSPQSFLPVYGDWELMAYLGSVKGADTGVPVLPVFSPEPLYFRSAHVVFVSTGFILKARSEKELAEAIQKAPLTVLSRVLPACGAMTSSLPAGFAETQQRLQEHLAGYEDVTTRHLKRRDPETGPRPTFTSGAETSPRSAPGSPGTPQP